jgi:hypothetical protein
MHHPHVRLVWKQTQVFHRLLQQHGIDTIIDAKDAFKPQTMVDRPAAPTSPTHHHQSLHQRGLHQHIHQHIAAATQHRPHDGYIRYNYDGL